jgi:PAS domain S-box-containing protein
VERSGPTGRQAIAGWRRVQGTPLVAVYILDPSEELSSLSTTRNFVQATFAAATILVLAGVGLAILAAQRRRTRGALQVVDEQRRLAERARAAYERRISGLPAVVYGGVLAPGAAFRLTHVSESAARILGHAAEDLRRPGSWAERLAPDDPGTLDAFLAAALAGGAAMRECRIRGPNGRFIWIRDELRVIERREDGEAEAVGYIADITEERNIQAKALSSSRLATLGEMATGLAHELNQPLAVMSLAAENATRALARRGEAGIPDAQARLARIGEQSQRARDIVDHLRLFGRSDEGEPEPVALHQAVEGALVLTTGALRKGGITLRLDLPDDLPSVLARLVPLEQSLVNLILNARDAIETQGRGEGEIVLHAAATADEVALSVTDDGGGIPEQVLERLFEPFFTTKAQGQGTGLGLAICHATMRDFGGSIAAENVPGGARFVMRFRRAPEPAREAAPAALDALLR